MRASGAHLHLQRPAIGLFEHVESLKSIATDGAEWTHVGRLHTVQQAQKEPDHVSGKDLMPAHAARFAPAARARRNHEVISLFNYRLDESMHRFRIVAAIAVEKHDNCAISGERAQARVKRTPVSRSRLPDHASSRSCRNFRRAIGAAIIDNNDLVGEIARHRADDFPNRYLLVKSGDEHGYMRLDDGIGHQVTNKAATNRRTPNFLRCSQTVTASIKKKGTKISIFILKTCPSFQ